MIGTNGIRLHVAEQGEGPLVILCHGFPECWYSWRHQLPALAKAGFRAVAPDLRGYGQSDRPEEVEKYTIFHDIGDIVVLVDALGAQQAVIAGHDIDAAIAWQTALLRPDRFRAVIALSPPVPPPPTCGPSNAAAAPAWTWRCPRWPRYSSPAGMRPPTPCCRPPGTAAWGWRWHRRPTPPMCGCSRASAGRRSPRRAPARSGSWWASTSTKNPDPPGTYYLGRPAALKTIDTVPEKTLLAFAGHGSLDDRLEPDYAAAERVIAAAADAGIDADALAEHLQNHGAGAFTADWAALLTAITQKTEEPTT